MMIIMSTTKPTEFILVVGKADGTWVTLAHMTSKVELLNRMSTTANALDFITKEPYALMVVDVYRTPHGISHRRVSRTDGKLSLREMQDLTANVEAM